MLFSSSRLTSKPITSCPSCLALSEDGQLLAVCGAELQILTPAFGIHVQSHAISHPGNAFGAAQTFVEPIPFLKTSAALRSRVRYDGRSNDARLVPPGQISTKWKSGCWSPSGLSELGTCLLVGITCNYDAVVFEPSSHHATGTWKQVANLTQLLDDQIFKAKDGDQTTMSETSKLQGRTSVVVESFDQELIRLTAAAWSYHFLVGGCTDRSILALGHRSGQTSFWRKGVEGMMLLSRSMHVKVAVTHLVWTPWSYASDGTATATLLVADSVGAITLMTHRYDPKGVSLISSYGVSPPLRIVAPDRRPVSQIQFLHTRGQRIITFAKTGTISFVYPDGKVHDLSLECSGNWPHSTPWAPAAGIQHLEGADCVVIALVDGSFHVIRDLDLGRPTLEYAEESATIASGEVCRSARTIFEALESLSLHKSRPLPALMHIFGLVAIGHALACVSDVHYVTATDHQQEARQSTLLSIFSTGNKPNDQLILQTADRALGETDSCLISSPLRLMLSTFIAIRGCQKRSLFDMTRHLTSTPQQVESPDTITAGLPLAFRIAAALFGSPCLQRLRLRAAFANYCHELTEVTPFKQAYDTLMQHISSRIYMRLSAVLQDELATNKEDERTLRRFSHTARVVSASSHDPSPTSDICFACKCEITMSELRYSRCNNGHLWERCCMTFELLGGQATKFCTSCRRQVRLANETDGPIARSLIESAKCCAYCGGRWSRVL